MFDGGPPGSAHEGGLQSVAKRYLTARAKRHDEDGLEDSLLTAVRLLRTHPTTAEMSTSSSRSTRRAGLRRACRPALVHALRQLPPVRLEQHAEHSAA